MEKVKVNGRYPYGNKILKSENIVSSIVEDEEQIHIRLDDKENLDFWMEIIIDKK